MGGAVTANAIRAIQSMGLNSQASRSVGRWVCADAYGDNAGRSGVSEGVDGIDPERALRGLDAR